VFWLSEVTRPYWHLTERGVAVDFASPGGGKVVWDRYSDPYFEHSMEAEDIVSKGFLSDKALVARLDTTLKLADVDLDAYDAIHVAGCRGARFDLFPNADVAAALEHFWAKDQVVGAICHSAIASATFRSEYAAARRPASRSREIKSCRRCSAAASSSRTIPRRSSRRSVRSIAVSPGPTIPTSSRTAGC
jgi:putative intracellular protease/amidase